MQEDLSTPTLCVSFEDVYHDCVNSNYCSNELALVVKSNEVEFPIVYPHNSGVAEMRTRVLDLRDIDFLCTAEVVKDLFALPYTSNDHVVAVHKMGNTLLVEAVNDVPGSEFFTSKSSESATIQSMTCDSHALACIMNDNGMNSPKSSHNGSNVNEEMNNEVMLKNGSPHLPPAEYYLPAVPLPSKNVLTWQLHEMTMAIGCDMNVYTPPNNRSVAVKSVDISQEFELSTCLDLYLDNVIANVPELALALHAKGFVRGIRTCATEDIPYISSAVLAESLLNSAAIAPLHPTKPGASSYTSHGNHHMNQHSPMFDPHVIDFDASAIMRFLKENCRTEDGTYLLRRSPTGESLHLYDLQMAPLIKQKKFKWMLAMLSNRFAIRLGHHLKLTNGVGKALIRQRQVKLFASCFDLLGEIKHMGGEDHGSIRASVLEHMADTHLSRVDEHTVRARLVQCKLNALHPPCHSGGDLTDKGPSDGGAGDLLQDGHDEDDDEDYNQYQECQEAAARLCQAVSCLEDMVRREISSLDSDADHEEEEEGEDSNDADEEGDKDKHDDSSPTGDAGVCDDEDEAGDSIVHSLAIQLTGVFHKLIQASLLMATSSLKSAKIAEAIQVLSQLAPSCVLWAKLNHCISARTSRQRRQQQKNHQKKGQKTGDPMWGSVMTLLQNMPLLWDVLGELYREIAKQTSGVSLHDTTTRTQLTQLLHVLRCLGFSALGQHSLCPVAVDETTGPSVGVSGNKPATAGAGAANDKNRKKRRAKAKSRSRRSTEAQVVHDWTAITSRIYITSDFFKTIAANNQAIGHLWLSNVGSHCAGGYSGADRVLQALYVVHSLVAPVALEQQNETQQQLGSSDSSCGLSALASCHDDLRVACLLTYCYICATLSHHHKSIAAHPAPTWSSSTARSSSSSTRPSSAKVLTSGGHQLSQPHLSHGHSKAHAQSSQPSSSSSPVLRSALVRPSHQLSHTTSTTSAPPSVKTPSQDDDICPTLATSDGHIRECLRRLADSCNVIGQRLLRCRCTASSVAGQEAFKQQVWDASKQVFAAGVCLFESTGDVVNAATIRSNLSSLLRSQAGSVTVSPVTVTMTVPLSNTCDGDKDVCDESQRADRDCFERKIVFLREALAQCDMADCDVAAGGDVSSAALIGATAAVRSERALNLLQLGVLHRLTYSSRSHEGASAYVTAAGGNALAPNSSSSASTSSLSSTIASRVKAAEDEDTVIAPLTRALELFTELKNSRQQAAVHYQLGAHYTCTWPYHTAHSAQASARLEKALRHYKEAHNYYSRHDVGPTMAHILTDMSDLYMASYQASEANLSFLHRLPGSNSNINNINNSATPVTQLAASSSQASELVTALLTGAVQSLVESRVAFTHTVAQRHGEEMTALASALLPRLCSALLCVLKCAAKGYILPPSAASTEWMKTAARDIIKLGKDASSNNSNSTANLYEMLDTLSKDEWLRTLIANSRPQQTNNIA